MALSCSLLTVYEPWNVEIINPCWSNQTISQIASTTPSKRADLSPKFFQLLKLSLAILICFNNFRILLKQFFSRIVCCKSDLPKRLNKCLKPMNVEANSSCKQMLQHSLVRLRFLCCLNDFFIKFLEIFFNDPYHNHEKMVKISKQFVEPYVSRVWEHGKKCFVKIAEKTGENGVKCRNSAVKEPYIGRFSQCQKMEGWNFNVSRTSW